MPLDLSSFVERYAKVVSKYSSLNEAETRRLVVDRFLEALGWDDVDVRLEYPVQMGAGVSKVDYCLTVDDRPVAFLEAKPLGSQLTIQNLQQAISYAKVKDVRWALVTDATDFIVMDAEKKSDAPRDVEVARFSLAAVETVPELAEALTPQGFRDGLLTQFQADVERRKAFLSRLQQNKEDVAKKFHTILSELHIADEMASDLIQRFLSDIESAAGKGNSQPSTRPAARTRSPHRDTLKLISRTELMGKPEDDVAILPANPAEPANPGGEVFLRRWRAWGFVNIGRTPKWCAIYLSAPEYKLKYIGRVSSVIEPTVWQQQTKADVSAFPSFYKPKKKVICFEPEALYELSDPVPWKSGDPLIQNLRYTNLGALRDAKRVSDLI